MGLRLKVLGVEGFKIQGLGSGVYGSVQSVRPRLIGSRL